MVLKKFPAVLTVMFYLCFFNAVLSTIYSLILVRDPNAWKLRPDMGLVAIFVIGAFIIVTGFYAVLWGKAKEEKIMSEGSGVESFKSSSSKVPLLQNKTEDLYSV
ncbi:hypothetical protein PTKIN_Ptkin02bG0090000 [Pterospermum kingtungense]